MINDMSQPTKDDLVAQLDRVCNTKCCQICHEPPFTPFTTICSHTFCRTCLRKWIEKSYTCPACRGTLFRPPGDRVDRGEQNELLEQTGGSYSQPEQSQRDELDESFGRVGHATNSDKLKLSIGKQMESGQPRKTINEITWFSYMELSVSRQEVYDKLYRIADVEMHTNVSETCDMMFKDTDIAFISRSLRAFAFAMLLWIKPSGGLTAVCESHWHYVADRNDRLLLRNSGRAIPVLQLQEALAKIAAAPKDVSWFRFGTPGYSAKVLERHGTNFTADATSLMQLIVQKAVAEHQTRVDARLFIPCIYNGPLEWGDADYNQIAPKYQDRKDRKNHWVGTTSSRFSLR